MYRTVAAATTWFTIAIAGTVVSIAGAVLAINAPQPRAPHPVGLGAGMAAPVSPTPSPSPSPQPRAPLPQLRPQVWAQWAVYDRHTHQVQPGGAAGRSSTESMIKVGIVADFLAGVEHAGRMPTARETDLMQRAIIDSDDQAAQRLYVARGGDQLVRRLIDTCALADTRITPGWWSKTHITAGDAATLGACIADGKVCSAPWAAWVEEQMRGVQGEGRFGIVEARPADRGRVLAIKNGWTAYDGQWHVACLAVADWWSAAVLVRYPAAMGLEYGGSMCARVAAAVLPPEEP